MFVRLYRSSPISEDSRDGSDRKRTCDDLSSTTLAVLGAFDDTGQVENLKRRAVDHERARNTAEKTEVSFLARSAVRLG